MIKYDQEFLLMPQVTFSLLGYQSENQFPSVSLKLKIIKKDVFFVDFSCE